jgi:hypothetical protein
MHSRAQTQALSEQTKQLAELAKKFALAGAKPLQERCKSVQPRRLTQGGAQWASTLGWRIATVLTKSLSNIRRNAPRLPIKRRPIIGDPSGVLQPGGNSFYWLDGLPPTLLEFVFFKEHISSEFGGVPNDLSADYTPSDVAVDVG